MLGSENGIRAGNQFSKITTSISRRPTPKSRSNHATQTTIDKISRLDVCVCWGEFSLGKGGGVYPKIHNIYHPQALHSQQSCITHPLCFAERSSNIKMWFEIFLCRVRAVPVGYREDFPDREGGSPFREAPGQTGRVDTYDTSLNIILSIRFVTGTL